MRNSNALKKELKRLENPEKAKVMQGFFKTGKREYAEGQKFLGLTVPEIRRIAKEYKDLSLSDIQKLLKSNIYEHKLAALFVLIDKYQKGDKKKIVDFYLDNTKNINNWGLVDSTAYKILGNYLLDKDRKILYRLAVSQNLWEKRIAIIATLEFIRNNQFDDTLSLCKILLLDKHDLIHKAVGWMLREVGNRDLETELNFLNRHYKKMPRTALRYAIEKFPEKLRRQYLAGKI